MDPRIYYVTPFFISSAFIFITGLYTIKYRRVRGSYYLIGLCIAAAVWSLCEGSLYFGLDADTNMFITQVQYIGISFSPPLTLLFVLSIFGFEYWVTRNRVLILFGIALLIVILVATNNLHHLIFTDYYTIEKDPFPMLGLEHGPIWTIILGYHYFLIISLNVVLLHQFFTSSRIYRYQAGVILIAVIIVWFVNIIYISGNSPIKNMDMSPIAFIFVAISMAWGFYRYHLLELMPVAGLAIFQGLDDSIFVIDHKDRVIDLNSAAQSMFKIDSQNVIGQSMNRILKASPKSFKKLNKMSSMEMTLLLDNLEHVFDIRISKLNNKRGEEQGKVITMRDITEDKRIEKALLESENKYRNLYETAPVAYFTVGKDSLIKRCNRKACELLGYSADELVGRPILDLYADTPEGKEKAIQAFVMFRKGIPVKDEEMQMQRADGSYIWVSLTENAIIDLDNNIIESHSMVVDLTRTKKQRMIKKE